ncbi:MAG: gamma carbonic anhydrase family protein, partial [Pseudomonadota bacterium]
MTDGLYTLDGVAPEIHETAWVAPGAHLMGKVRLAEEASVWFNAVLRGDNEWISVGAR